MPLLDSDIKWFYTGDGTPAGSTGGGIAATEWFGATVNDLFADVTAALMLGTSDSGPTVTPYTAERAVFLANTHGSIAWKAVKVWQFLTTPPITGTALTLSLGAGGVQDVGTATTSGPGGYAPCFGPTAGLAVGDLAPGKCRAVWLKMTTTPAAFGGLVVSPGRLDFSVRAAGGWVDDA